MTQTRTTASLSAFHFFSILHGKHDTSDGVSWRLVASHFLATQQPLQSLPISRTGPDRNHDGFKTFTRNALQWEEGTGRKWQGFSASCSFWKARVECTTRDDGGCVVPRNDDGRAVPRHLPWTCFALARGGREGGNGSLTGWRLGRPWWCG